MKQALIAIRALLFATPLLADEGKLLMPMGEVIHSLSRSGQGRL